MLQESIFEPSKSDTRDKTEAECLAALRSYLPAQLRLVMGKKRSEIMIMIMMMMMIMMIMIGLREAQRGLSVASSSL